MLMLKTDYPRAIDRVIDFFGERGPIASPPPSPKPAKAAIVRAA
jgi:hypothetical protein